jgi:hypothetical protein
LKRVVYQCFVRNKVRNSKSADTRIFSSSLPLAVTTVPRHGTRRDAALTPLAGTLGFVRLPGAYFVFLGGMTVTDLALVELVKRRLMRKLLGKGTAAEPLLRSVA